MNSEEDKIYREIIKEISERRSMGDKDRLSQLDDILETALEVNDAFIAETFSMIDIFRDPEWGHKVTADVLENVARVCREKGWGQAEFQESIQDGKYLLSITLK